MAWLMRLVEDVLPNGATMRLPHDGALRVLHVVHGQAVIDGRRLGDGMAWHGTAEIFLEAGASGVTVWRFEIASQGSTVVPAGTGRTVEKLCTAAALPEGDLLVRHDSVAFPPSGCALLHTHQGPGIRCLVEGGIRIDTAGRSSSYAPGGTWFEPGPEPVFAQAAGRPTRFLRVMVLPRALLGRPSIRYVREEDRDKPKSQLYEVFIDAPIEL